MRRKRLMFVLLLSAALALSCTKRDRGAEVVRFWQFWDVGTMETLVRAFEAEHPGVRVEVEQLTWKSGLEKIQAAIASGTQPDLCELGSTWVPRFSYEGTLEDLTAVYSELADSFLMWESAMWKGRAYGLPWLQGSRVLFYNGELFSRAGLDPDQPPATWQDLLEASERIDALAPDIYGFGLNLGERYVLYKKFMAFAWGCGGRILSDEGEVLIDSPENVEALEFYVELSKHALREKQEVLDHHFKIGKLGMQLSGAWNLKNYAIEAPGLDYGVALVPRPSERKGIHASFAGAEMLVIFKRSKVKALALELARLLQDYSQARALSLSVGSVFPASRRALMDSTFLGDTRLRVFVEQSLTSRSAPPHPGWIEMEEVLNRSLEEVLYARATPQQALSTAAAQIRGIVSRYE